MLARRTSAAVITRQRAAFSTEAATKLYSWGIGNDGQLGTGDVLKTGITNSYQVLAPEHIYGAPPNLVDLAFGNTHSAAVDADGRVYTWGSGADDKLGHATKDNQIRPKLVEALEPVSIKSVSCGDRHTAALDDEGNLYTWGWGGSWFSGAGALGTGDSSSETLPVLLDSLYDDGVYVQQMGSGEQHMMALDNQQKVWVWGAGEYGRLGDGGSSDELLPVIVDYFVEQEIAVESIAVGHAFNLVLTTEGQVYCWGKNDKGQLGLGGGLAMDVFSMENFPRLIEGALAGVRVKYIAAGDSHAGAVTEDGRVFMWGMGNWLEPEEMTSLQANIVQLDCGRSYSACLSDDGILYTFGHGNTCCLGHGNKSGVVEPQEVEFFSRGGMKVSNFSCGANHIGALVN